MSLLMIMEHILSFQHKTYWKKYDLKNALKKEIFWQKSLTHSVNLCTTILMVGHPSAPVSSKHAISGVQSGWAATYLADSVPSVTLQGRCALQNVDPVVMQHTGLPSSGLVELYVRQVVCVCVYSLCKNMYYTCNIEYTARWVCPASDSFQPFLGCKYLLNDLYNTHRPPLCRALLTAQFAGVIEGAADFLLRPSIVQLSDYTRPDRQWGS